MYKKLVRRLDQEGEAVYSRDAAYIDMWFREAYWKLGTLYLDRKLYVQAVYEISRAILAVAFTGDPRLLEQAYSFIAESYYELGDYDEAACYVEASLEMNPRNSHALEIEALLDSRME